jgi:hypothetical protein
VVGPAEDEALLKAIVEDHRSFWIH